MATLQGGGKAPLILVSLDSKSSSKLERLVARAATYHSRLIAPFAVTCALSRRLDRTHYW